MSPKGKVPINKDHSYETVSDARNHLRKHLNESVLLETKPKYPPEDHHLWFVGKNGYKKTNTTDGNYLHTDMMIRHKEIPWRASYREQMHILNNTPKGRSIVNHGRKTITHVTYGWGVHPDVEKELREKHPTYKHKTIGDSDADTPLKENYINFGDYHLVNKFNHYNQLLFDNTVPTCPLSFNHLDGAAGITVFKHIGRRLIPGSMRIELSTRFKRTEQSLDSTLIHEMIHAYLASHGLPTVNHGLEFRVLAQQCAKKVGFPIPLNDEINDLELTHEEKVMTTVVLTTIRGVWHANFYSGTYFDSHDKMDQLVAFWGAPGRMSVGEEMLVVKAYTSLIAKYGSTRNVGKNTWIRISDAESHELLQHGTVLRRIEPNSMSHEDAASKMPTKETLAVLKTTHTGAVQGTFYFPTIAKDPKKLQQLKNKWALWTHSGYTVEILLTRSTVFTRGFSMFRDPDKGSYYNLKPDTVAELRRNSTHTFPVV